jgi:hypothetical protein
MAVQGCRPRWKSNGTSGVLERDQNILSPGNFIYGPYEGMVTLLGSSSPKLR